MNARPVWLFMAATAMATTVSTLTATALVALGALAVVRRSRGAVWLQRALYAGALSAGHISPEPAAVPAPATTGGRS